MGTKYIWRIGNNGIQKARIKSKTFYTRAFQK